MKAKGEARQRNRNEAFFCTLMNTLRHKQSGTPGSGYFGHYSLIPVTLGTQLTLVANGFITNQAGDGEGTTSAYLDTEFQFRFFEVDESTPVPVQALSEVPEPSTAAMLLIPALAFGFFRVRRQQA